MFNAYNIFIQKIELIWKFYIIIFRMTSLLIAFAKENVFCKRAFHQIKF